MSSCKFLLLSLSILFISCSPKISNWASKESPTSFKAKFETTQGDFIVEFHREWSPLAVDRAFQLIQSGFYDSTAFHRVVKDYVAQFGISNDSTKNHFWTELELKDEPVVKENTEGTLSFARGGPHTRGTQLFINLKNNSPRLDTLNYSGVTGFPVVGKIIEGAEVPGLLFSGYGNNVNQEKIQKEGYTYLSSSLPDLDYIIRARVIK
ncbi:MAG: peptidylprolyl isomerase [Cyclobacteriaceae bacterium]